MNRNDLYQKYIVSKHCKLCLEVLSYIWQRINQVAGKIRQNERERVSYSLIKKALNRLKKAGKVECSSKGNVLCWRLKFYDKRDSKS